MATELASHNRPEIQAGMRERFAKMERIEADDIGYWSPARGGSRLTKS